MREAQLHRDGWASAWRYVALLCCLPGLSGCGKFFHPTSTGSGGTGSGSGSGSGGGSGGGSGLNSVYVANGSTQFNNISAFSLAGGNLANLPDPSSSAPITPTALAITPLGKLLYVGSYLGPIYVYVVNSDGSLSLGNGGNTVANIAANALAVDPTGNWLVAMSGSIPGAGTGSTPVTISTYQINPANGGLTTVVSPASPVVLDNGSAAQLVFAPNGTQMYAALGTGGVDALSFNPSTGVPAKLSVYLAPGGNSYSDQGLAIDPLGKYLFVTETGSNGVRVYAIHADSTLTQVGLPYPTGTTANSASGPRAVLVDKTGAYVYVGNSTIGTISGFSLASTGVLTAMAGSPFATGVNPQALAEDSTKGYIYAACSGGTPDLQVYSITAGTGALVPAASTANGNSASGAIALATSP